MTCLTNVFVILLTDNVPEAGPLPPLLEAEAWRPPEDLVAYGGERK